MSLSDLSIEEVETMNMECADKMAGFMQEQERRLTYPDRQLLTFGHFLPGRRVLDVGCGSARYADEFPKRDMHYVGIDYSPNMLAIARERHPTLDFRQMNLRELEFEDGSFDGIWCCCALGGTPKRYIPDVLAGFKRVLVPGGALLVMLPLTGESIEYVGETRVPEAGNMYHAEWHLEEFRDALVAAGFVMRKSLNDLPTGTNTLLAQVPE